MAAARDSFIDLERHRQLLEENVKKLSKALNHWKQWRTEYEALRSEVKALPPATGRQELRSTREKFEAELYHELLNKKELVDIFGRDDSKKPEQIISTLTNRLDYVGKNIDTLAKQLEEAENKLAAVTVVANPDATDEEGLPITEIFEELDDDDNVISYSLRRPGDSQPQLLEALKKAGITDLSPDSDDVPVPEASQDARNDESRPSKAAPSPPAQSPEKSHDSASQPNHPEEPRADEAPKKTKTKPVTKKKSVTFSEDTKPAEQFEQSETAKRLEEILQKAKDQQSIISDPVFPADESAEDRELREHMIRYNKDTMEYEMNPIVAELQLEEGSTDDDADDYSGYDDDEEEDQWGRSKIDFDDDWKRQMLELKERLSEYTFEDEEDASDDDEDMVEGIGRITIKREGGDISMSNAGATSNGESVAESPTKDSISTEDAPKKVRFAQSLNIAEPPASAPDATQAKKPKQAEVDPLSDVMERGAGTSQPVTNTTTQSKKVSRFRKGRTNDPPINANPIALGGTPILPEMPKNYGKVTPSGPEGTTLASSVLEHEPSSEVKEPDEFDADLLQKQVLEDYNKKRNQLIHRQGGFMKEDENPIQPLDEEEGGPKRMSRFKAARLGQI
ncbi:Prefoldin subunit-domain-containing protein [Hypoxylon rubiginosum]|uniref:Prefoldin subunit-domain-containing protein n=1 Tax=Hypoxylon rubiginosum TaxID=110542 RepID=A0ACC0CQ43_9PEZI|nr:Prefoldin subunit-domain-containing protein [Hypoxylon rubiginosum]